MSKRVLFALVLCAAFAVYGKNAAPAKTVKTFHKDAYINLLCELVRTRPVTADAAAVNKAQLKMMQFLTERGIYCTMERDGERDVLFAATAPGKVQDYVLCVHLDVVPAVEEKQYEPVIKGGRLYARGSKDCLGPAVAAAKILCSLPKGKKVGCIFTSDEEVGGSTTAFMVQKGYRAEKMNFVLDGGSGVYYAQKGILDLKVTAYGKAGHSSRPWACDDPVAKLIRGLNRVVEKWENPVNSNDWKSSLAITVLSAGSIHNRIPEKAEARINIRVVKLDDIKRIFDFVKKTSGLEVTVVKTSDPFETAPESKEMKKVLSAYNRAFGRNTKPQRMCGATDARHTYKMRCPTFITGLDGYNSHGRDEYIELGSIDKLVTMIIDVI